MVATDMDGLDQGKQALGGARQGPGCTVVTGVLIAESLRVGSLLQDLPLRVDEISRIDAGDVDAGQPRTWTFIHFEAPVGDADGLAAALSSGLQRRGGWYCNFRSGDDTFIVFADAVFRYPRGDTVRRAEAEDFARSCGVPEPQLDWEE
jgi:hypothetical protein